VCDVIRRFNFAEDQEENAIVTSTGPFVIAWDFAKVKKGIVDKYEIKKYEDAVVQDNWRINSDQEIVRCTLSAIILLIHVSWHCTLDRRLEEQRAGDYQEGAQEADEKVFGSG